LFIRVINIIRVRLDFFFIDYSSIFSFGPAQREPETAEKGEPHPLPFS